MTTPEAQRQPSGPETLRSNLQGVQKELQSTIKELGNGSYPSDVHIPNLRRAMENARSAGVPFEGPQLAPLVKILRERAAQAEGGLLPMNNFQGGQFEPSMFQNALQTALMPESISVRSYDDAQQLMAALNGVATSLETPASPLQVRDVQALRQEVSKKLAQLLLEVQNKQNHERAFKELTAALGALQAAGPSIEWGEVQVALRRAFNGMFGTDAAQMIPELQRLGAASIFQEGRLEALSAQLDPSYPRPGLSEQAGMLVSRINGTITQMASRLPPGVFSFIQQKLGMGPEQFISMLTATVKGLLADNMAMSGFKPNSPLNRLVPRMQEAARQLHWEQAIEKYRQGGERQNAPANLQQNAGTLATLSLRNTIPFENDTMRRWNQCYDKCWEARRANKNAPDVPSIEELCVERGTDPTRSLGEKRAQEYVAQVEALGKNATEEQNKKNAQAAAEKQSIERLNTIFNNDGTLEQPMNSADSSVNGPHLLVRGKRINFYKVEGNPQKYFIKIEGMTNPLELKSGNETTRATTCKLKKIAGDSNPENVVIKTNDTDLGTRLGSILDHINADSSRQGANSLTIRQDGELPVGSIRFLTL